MHCYVEIMKLLKNGRDLGKYLIIQILILVFEYDASGIKILKFNINGITISPV